jgi:hypothetical protein
VTLTPLFLVTVCVWRDPMSNARESCEMYKKIVRLKVKKHSEIKPLLLKMQP